MVATRSIGQVLGERLLMYRKRAGLTQEELAQRTASFGEPMNRVTIAKIEGAAREHPKSTDRTRADNATLVDVLVLAAALDVPPPLLFIPLGQVELTRFGSAKSHPHLLLDWVCGDAPLTTQPRNRIVGHRGPWMENAETIWAFRTLRAKQDAVHMAESDLRYVEHDGDRELCDRMSVVVDHRLRELDVHLVAMRAAGIESLPELPVTWTVRMAELRLKERQ